MNEKSRKYYLPVRKTAKDGTVTSDIQKDFDKKKMYDNICALIQSSAFITSLGKNLISFSGVTDGYWKDLEPKGKKFMIVSMDNGDYIRAAGRSGGDLSGSDILYEFVIVDGIDYKSNYVNHKLLYMEV